MIALFLTKKESMYGSLKKVLRTIKLDIVFNLKVMFTDISKKEMANCWNTD